MKPLLLLSRVNEGEAERSPISFLLTLLLFTCYKATLFT
jgi:hypothetical protein